MNGYKQERRHFSISVVIPNYNGKHLLEANLPSVVAALNSTKTECEIIVVDDASSDGSVLFLQQQYPNIKLLVNEINQGFSPTINKGIFAAKYDLILALNSDVKLTTDYFKEQFRYFEKPDTFGVMGKIVDSNEKQIQDAAKFPKTGFKGIKATYNYLPAEIPDGFWLPTFFLSGANALMDRKKLLELGGFDELFAPFYFEDADLGIRAWRVGWKCYFEPQSVCMHAVSSTISKLKSQKVKAIIERNRIIFNYLHLTGRQLYFYKYWLLVRCYGKLILGNRVVFRAVQLVRSNLSAVKRSHQALEMVQKRRNCFYSVQEIEHYILKQIEKIPYRVF